MLGARSNELLVEELVSAGYPIGIFDLNPLGKEESNRIVVNLDDERAAHDAFAYLCNLGHRRIGILNGDIHRSAGTAKMAGFLAAARERGIPIRSEWFLDTDFSEAGGYASMRAFLESGIALPSAFAAANDTVAFGAMRALQECKVRIPDDISVIGIDDHPMAKYQRPALTTFKYDFLGVMRRLVELLVSRIESRDTAGPKRALFSPVFVERESCRAIKEPEGSG